MSTATPATVIELVHEAQKQALSTLEQFQRVSLEAAEAAGASFPGEPWPGFANTLPKPTELVEAAYGFYGKVLESQKAYALRLAEVATKAADAGATSIKKAAR